MPDSIASIKLLFSVFALSCSIWACDTSPSGTSDPADAEFMDHASSPIDSRDQSADQLGDDVADRGQSLNPSSDDASNSMTLQPSDATVNPPDLQEDQGDVQATPTLQPDRLLSLTEQIAGNPIQRRYGIAITDIDLNGDYEVVVTGYGAPNEVYDYEGGLWVDRAPESLKDPTRRAIGVAACDVNGDGREELYFLNVDRFGGLGEVSDRLYIRDGQEEWADLFERAENQTVINQFSGRSVACLDRYGQGKYGVFVANYGGPMKLFELGDTGELVDVGAMVGINLTTGGRGLLALPRPEAGMHIFAGNEGGANFLFINRGGTFEERAARAGIADPAETVRGVATLDVNEDGLFDLVYGNWEGPHRLFIAQPPTEDRDFVTYVDQAPAEMSLPSRIRTVIAADLDNDGYEELFFNNIGEPNRLFRRGPDGWVQIELDEALEPEGLGTGAAVVDSNQDGRLELWIAHGESGAQPLSLYQWGDQGYHWLRIAPKTPAGAPARGARVTLYQPNGRVQRRVIDAGSGYLCQMEPVAHFGLGDLTEVDRVVVEWVDGSRSEVLSPDVDQVLSLSPASSSTP